MPNFCFLSIQGCLHGAWPSDNCCLLGRADEVLARRVRTGLTWHGNAWHGLRKRDKLVWRYWKGFGKDLFVPCFILFLGLAVSQAFLNCCWDWQLDIASTGNIWAEVDLEAGGWSHPLAVRSRCRLLTTPYQATCSTYFNIFKEKAYEGARGANRTKMNKRIQMFIMLMFESCLCMLKMVEDSCTWLMFACQGMTCEEQWTVGFVDLMPGLDACDVAKEPFVFYGAKLPRLPRTNWIHLYPSCSKLFQFIVSSRSFDMN